MNRALILELLLVLAQALATAQQPADSPSDTLRFDKGTLANGAYTNECLGFSLAIPVGWGVNSHGRGADAGRVTLRNDQRWRWCPSHPFL